jgi:uncharacterized protein DUF1236
MKKTLFSSVAVAALALGTAFAVAQGTGGGAGGGAGNPGSVGGPSGGAGGGGAVSPGGSAGGGSAERRQSQGGEPGQPPARAQQGQGGQERPAGRVEGQQTGGRTEGQQPAGRAEGQQPAGQKQTTGQSQQGTSSQATGAIGGAGVTVEQRTQVRQSFSNVNVHRVQNVNFAISIGTTVPRSVTFYDLPPEIIRIVPAYRRFKYVAVGDEIVIIDPERYVIVEVIRI